jgi:hypothetical protein
LMKSTGQQFPIHGAHHAAYKKSSKLGWRPSITGFSGSPSSRGIPTVVGSPLSYDEPI